MAGPLFRLKLVKVETGIPIERYYCDFTQTPFGDQIIPKNGDFAVPQGPGLGQDPDLDLVVRMRVA